MTKQEIIDQCKNDVYARLFASPIHGVGVVAIKDIPKGTCPFVGCDDQGWQEITNEELMEIPDSIKKVIADMLICEDGKWWMPNAGIQKLDISYFLNHSENANMESDDAGTFTATRDIKAGEELTSNYNQYDDDIGREGDDFRRN
jgi:hypothetical protein